MKRYAQFESLEKRELLAAAITISEGWTELGSQLRITGTAASDKIVINKVGRGYVINAQRGFTATYRGNYKSLLINGGRGNDRIVLADTIRIPTEINGGAGKDTLVGGSGNDSIYGNAGADLVYGQAGDDTIVSTGDRTADVLSGGLGADSFWTDSGKSERVLDLSKAEARSGALHRISGFASVQSTMMAALSMPAVSSTNLVDPAVDKAEVTYLNYADRPLFAAKGPTADDVVQGDLGDCYLLAPLASVAEINPRQIRQTVVDLGDGTYAVHFHRRQTDVYVRVDADLPSWSKDQLTYADFGADGSIWVAIVEKAFALFRGTSASYAGIDNGWMTEAFDALGMANTSDYSTYSLATRIDRVLRAGKAVTYATAEAPAGSKLLSYHAYSVDRVVENRYGSVVSIVLRNPWAVDGAGTDGIDDGYVTVSVTEFTAAFSGVVVARSS